MREIKLLLVDDEDEFRQATAQALGRRGFVVREAESGARALQRVREELPEVVVLDLRMPGMDGVETLSELRKLHADLPVVILTGHGGLDDALAGIKLEVVDFLQKPLQVEHLAVHVRRLLASRRGPLRERTIGDLMVPAAAFERVREDRPVRELLSRMRVSSPGRPLDAWPLQDRRVLFVEDEGGKLVGCVRAVDLLSLLIPPALGDSPYALFFTGMFLAQCKLVGNLPAGDLPLQRLTIDVQASLMDAVHLMVSERVEILPVLREGELVGVLREQDLLTEMALLA